MLLNQDLDDKARLVIYWTEGLIIIKKKKTIFKLIYFYAFAAAAYTIQYIKFNFGGHKQCNNIQNQFFLTRNTYQIEIA